MPGRQYSAATGYRYGFNGKENDNEVKGDGNQLNFEARVYDSRIARWLSVDPLQKKYPNESPYIFSGNSPLLFKDADGKEKIITITILHENGSRTTLKLIDKNYFHYHTVNNFVTTNGHTWTHKDNLYINYTIDATNKDNFKITKDWHLENIDENYTWDDKISDWWNNLSSSPRKYGLTMSGGGDVVSPAAQLEWDSNLPKAEQSDYIGSITLLLDAASAYGEIAEIKPSGSDILNEFTDSKELTKFIKGIENYTNAIKTADNANQLIPENLINYDEVERYVIKPGTVYYDKDTKSNYLRLTDSSNQCCAPGPATDTVEQNSTKPVSTKKP